MLQIRGIQRTEKRAKIIHMQSTHFQIGELLDDRFLDIKVSQK